MTLSFDEIETVGQCRLQSRERPHVCALCCPSPEGLVLVKGGQMEDTGAWVKHRGLRQSSNTPLTEILRSEVV